jgi:transcriptional regulator with XRE-family HTH domain
VTYYIDTPPRVITLTTFRKQRQAERREVARRMGTTQSSIARIEGGGSLPTLGMLARLAHATGTPLRLAAPGITGVDLGGAASPDPAARLPAPQGQHARVSATNPRAL